MPLFRALAKNMAPMTNADESPTNRLTLFPIYLSLFVVSTLIGSPKIGVESFILMIEHILVSILFDLTRATLLSLRNTLTLL